MAKGFDSNIRVKHPESMAKPPDGGWGWLVVFAAFSIHVFTDGITYSFGLFYTEFLEVFKESQSKTSWINSLLGGIILCSGPIACMCINRWGCQAVAVGGTIIATTFIISSSFAKSVTALIFIVGFGVALGFSFIYVPAIVSVTVWFEKKRSFATGIAVCGSGLGTFIFAPMIAALIAHYGWRGALLILGGLVLICAPLGLLFKPVPVPVNKNIDSKPSIDAEPGHSKPIKKPLEAELAEIQKLRQPVWVSRLLKNPIFIVLLVSNFMTCIGFFIPYVYTKPHAEKMGVTNAEYLISTIGGANVLGRLTVGYICDKPGVNRLWAYTSSVIICGIAVAAAAICTGFWTLACHSAVFGFTIGSYVVLLSVVIVDLLGLDKLTYAFGIALLGAGIASIIGPPIAGRMFDVWGTYTPVFVSAGVCVIVSGVILLPIPIIKRWMHKKESQNK